MSPGDLINNMADMQSRQAAAPWAATRASSAAQALALQQQNIAISSLANAAGMGQPYVGVKECGKGHITVELREISNGYLLEHRERVNQPTTRVFCKDLTEAGQALIAVYAQYQME